MVLEFSAASKDFDFKSFDCGEKSLNDYLRFYALKNDKNSISRIFIAYDTQDNTRTVLGYYTVSSAQIAFEDYPEGLSGKIPRYPIPAVRIGRPASSVTARGKGVGAALLKDALHRAVAASQEVAIHCIIVDALHEKAAAFYRKYGFTPIKDDLLTLVIPMAAILDSLG